MYFSFCFYDLVTQFLYLYLTCTIGSFTGDYIWYTVNSNLNDCMAACELARLSGKKKLNFCAGWSGVGVSPTRDYSVRADSISFS